MGSQRDWVTRARGVCVISVFSSLQEGFDLQVASAFIDNYPPDHITSSLAINEWLNFSIWTKKTNCLCIFNFKDLWPSFLTSELVVSFWELTQKYALELSERNDGWKQIVQIEEFKTVQSFLFITYPCTFKAPPPMCSYCQNLQISWTSISCQHGQTLPSPGEPGNSSCCFGMGLIPGSVRSPAEGNGNSLQYSCLENPMGRGAWWATVRGVARVWHDLVTKPTTPIPPL